MGTATPNIPSFNISPEILGSLPTISTIVWILFFAVALYTTVHVGVFAYHWYAYNIAPKRFFRLTALVYFVGVLILLSTLFISTIAITASL